MANHRKNQKNPGDLVAVDPAEVTVLPPSGVVVGNFLNDTRNMFTARAVRMAGQLTPINESGQRTEALLPREWRLRKQSWSRTSRRRDWFQRLTAWTKKVTRMNSQLRF